MDWTIEQVTNKLQEVANKGFLAILSSMYRSDEGVVGQILEREFGVQENNLSLRDLGTFELKAMRFNSKTLTLCHKTTSKGLTPLEIFDRFGYIKPSKRDPAVLKKKLFTTVKGNRANNHGFILHSGTDSSIDMFCKDEFICQWELTEQLEKIDKIILTLAKTQGKVNSKAESFHYVKADIYDSLKNLSSLVNEGTIVIDFCIDQPVGSNRSPHDRGPHIRIPKSKLPRAYNNITPLLDSNL
ncbi:MAG: hypothetical protein FVQ80_06070 [Planctomycetes bacterium]|nr:hypothetical protein [Planctomycetota bacterium]